MEKDPPCHHQLQADCTNIRQNRLSDENSVTTNTEGYLLVTEVSLHQEDRKITCASNDTAPPIGRIQERKRQLKNNSSRHPLSPLSNRQTEQKTSKETDNVNGATEPARPEGHAQSTPSTQQEDTLLYSCSALSGLDNLLATEEACAHGKG